MIKGVVRLSLFVMLLVLLTLPSSAFSKTFSATEGNGNSLPAGSEDKEPYTLLEYTEASVHDPSVIKVDDAFYVFGSHLASAKTKDFMNWEQISSSVHNGNPLIPNVYEELQETFEWAETDTLWAPDVIQLEDDRFYMYYCASRGDSPRSALGVAVSNDIEGPYKDLGIILKSGMWGEPSEDGTIYDATVHPNVVDPHTFFDKDGKLWMVYGSYSGGIFILEMDNETGLPFPGQGYGKKLTGGNHSRMEGPYIHYSPETDYYYLNLTFGGLAADGGYNMRVARSKNPDGPYYDSEGNDMIKVKSDPDLPLFDDRSIEPYGVKLMGNFLFDRSIGEAGEGIGIGYVSPGHNSTYYDAETGKHLLLFHTRFPERGEVHEIRVHQMFMNKNGWPVIAPYRYAGETLEKVFRSELIGEYKLINHGKDISAEIKETSTIKLNKNNKISGDITGKWKKTDHNRAELKIDGKTYDGVFLRQRVPDSESYVMTFSALSDAGVAIWGSKVAKKTDEEIVDGVLEDLNLGDTSAVYYDLTLPIEATRGAEISWTSSNPDIVSADGVVRRPAAGLENKTITLSATIIKGEVTGVKNFKITVLAESI